jgi:hypothetical protein
MRLKEHVSYLIFPKVINIVYRRETWRETPRSKRTRRDSGESHPKPLCRDLKPPQVYRNLTLLSKTIELAIYDYK